MRTDASRTALVLSPPPWCSSFWANFFCKKFVLDPSKIPQRFQVPLGVVKKFKFKFNLNSSKRPDVRRSVVTAVPSPSSRSGIVPMLVAAAAPQTTPPMSPWQPPPWQPPPWQPPAPAPPAPTALPVPAPPVYPVMEDERTAAWAAWFAEQQRQQAWAQYHYATTDLAPQ